MSATRGSRIHLCLPALEFPEGLARFANKSLAGDELTSSSQEANLVSLQLMSWAPDELRELVNRLKGDVYYLL